MPESGEKVFYHWLENIEPWTIPASSGGATRSVWYGPKKKSDPNSSLISISYASDLQMFCATTEEEAIELTGIL